MIISRSGTVEIKKCGFSERAKLMVPEQSGEDEPVFVDVLADLFRQFEGKKVKVTIELEPV